MVIKIVALGKTYFNDIWNKFDVIILVVDIFAYMLDGLKLDMEGHHAVRLLRLISRLASFKELVSDLLSIMPMLVNAFPLFIFFIYICSLLGVQMWAGELRNRCFLEEDVLTNYNVSMSPYYLSAPHDKFPFICSLDHNDGTRRCRDIPASSKNGTTCSLAPPRGGSPGNASVPAVVGAGACVNWNVYYSVCRAGDDNPSRGATNFDNIGYAWLTIFQVVSLEGWTDVMYMVMDSHSFWSFLFFVLVTVAGSFVIMNVCAVVIATQFSDIMRKKADRQRPGFRATIKRLWSQMIRTYMRFGDQVYPEDSPSPKTMSMGQIFRPWQRRLQKSVRSKVFTRGIMLAIMLSIITMAIEHHEQPLELTRALEISNEIFTIIFAVEMVMKLLALGPSGYFTDQDNIFDFIIVIVSVWEFTSKTDSKLSALRAFRALRFVRLIHALPYLRRQLVVLQKTVEEASTLCCLTLFFIFVFSVLGLHLFGCTFNLHSVDGKPIDIRKNFDTLLWSMVTVFQLLTLEDWNLVLYNAMASTTPWAALYFIAVIVFGKDVLLNVLVGIVVDKFQATPASGSEGNDYSSSDSLTPNKDPAGATQEDNPAPVHGSRKRASFKGKQLNFTQRLSHWLKEREDWSFYMLSPDHRCRVFFQRMISHRVFDPVILLFILMNCVTIAMERPGINLNSWERAFISMSSTVFTVIFLMEMLIKVLALGLFVGPQSYCRSPWNIMDGMLVVLSLIHITIRLTTGDENHMLGILKILRLLRTFRPLRVIKRAPKLKLAVEALMASMRPMGNITLICCMFLFFYAILGVQLFKGKFFFCVGESTQDISNKTQCLAAGYHWDRKTFHFDNLFDALISLFVMYSKDGWVNIMYDGLDAVGVNQQPLMNYNQWMLLYFLSFMVMSFFLLDMFIGVMVETFHQTQQRQRKEDERLRREAERIQGIKVVEVPYYELYTPVRRDIHTVCTNKYQDFVITVLIVLSVLIMGLEHYKQPVYIVELLENVHSVLTIIMVVEVFLKIVAFGIVRFFRSSVIFRNLEMSDKIPINPSILRVCRVLRLTRVLKAKNIRVLLKTISETLTQAGNVCLLFMFFFFIFAAVGVELFGQLECTADYLCMGIHRHANFMNFGVALLTLYRVCTGDNWSNIFKDTLRECRPGVKSCSRYLRWASPLYFASFVVMAQFVLANLVVAAIMQAMEDSNKIRLPVLPAPLLLTQPSNPCTAWA
ncbi:LOW QUALITY PROTEIN: voltage-dependent T-type calcium channel subunit alpha-1I-like [Brachyistius frenatus]|uniref:LOW QUALITY PROTEIN: voltage-dependent T-type calcium channel subunit alpha-1I-like n=1 Tax=Brachyistius frenatus TaxID=100188 RepID=UPI0037E939A9